MDRQENNLFTLILLKEFKALTNKDDRDDELSRYFLEASTSRIERYCKRWLLRKKLIEDIDFCGDLILPLKEYPVSKVLAVFANKEIVEPDFYTIVPDSGITEDIPFYLSLSHAPKRYKNLKTFKVMYWAGYKQGKIPADLASACLELAPWNMNRCKGQRFGLTGKPRGSGKDGEHFEIDIPENVKSLLEPYRRKTI